MSNESNHNAEALLALVEQHSGADFVRELLIWAAHQVIEPEVDEIVGGGKGERRTRRSGSSRAGGMIRDGHCGPSRGRTVEFPHVRGDTP